VTHPVIVKLDSFLAKSPSFSQKDAALMSLWRVFRDSAKRPAISEYVAFVVGLKKTDAIAFLSMLLDAYSPSVNEADPEMLSSDWSFLATLTPEQRLADRSFFEAIWRGCEKRQMAMTTSLREVLLASMFKHSGLTNDFQFSRVLQAIEKKAGYIPFELLAVYEDDEKELRPLTLIFNWVRLCVFAYGLSATVSLLAALCEKRAEEDYYDVDRLWMSYVATLKIWPNMTYGEVLIETQRLADLVAVALPASATIPSRMGMPLAAVPEGAADDSDDLSGWLVLPLFK
jgi:hypothetical protein